MTHITANTKPTKKATVDILSTIVNDFVLNMARRDLGNNFATARFMGAALEKFSDDAKAARYHKLIEKGTFDDLFELYESATHSIGNLFMTVLAPNALSYDDFVSKCSKATSYVKISPACPACHTQNLSFCVDFVVDAPLDNSLEVVCECSHCGLSPLLDIQIVKPQSEHEGLIRSYVRSLLAYEQYDKDHGLGPIHDSRTLVRVAEQAAKALVHLPDGLSIDYQTLVLDEMTR